MLVPCNVKINEFCILWIPPSPNASTQICRTSQTKDDFHISRSMSIETRKIDIDGGCDAMLCFAIPYFIPCAMFILKHIETLCSGSSSSLMSCDSLSQFIHLGHVQIGRFLQQPILWMKSAVRRELGVCSYITGLVVHAIVSKQTWNFACGISPVRLWKLQTI